MRDEGLLRYIGLSEVSVADINAASTAFDVATVQNRYNLTDRHSEDVLQHCERHGIGFIPWYPLAAGSLAQAGSVLRQIARAHNPPRPKSPSRGSWIEALL
jgi:aryl-alcohol dehydrogenase-like predicted oxidoreductase